MATQKSSTYETAILALLLNATPIANIADNTATSPLTNLYVALHTASPGATGNQSTNEVTTAAYTGYTRVAVTRSNGSPAWTITGNSPASASPNSAINFPQATTGSTGATITYVSIGSAATGAGVVYYFGSLATSIPISVGTQPQLTTATAITET